MSDKGLRMKHNELQNMSFKRVKYSVKFLSPGVNPQRSYYMFLGHHI